MILFLGIVLFLFPRLFTKIGWFNFENLDGNEGTWEKNDKKSVITRKIICVYRVIGFTVVVFSLVKLLN